MMSAILNDLPCLPEDGLEVHVGTVNEVAGTWRLTHLLKWEQLTEGITNCAGEIVARRGWVANLKYGDAVQDRGGDKLRFALNVTDLVGLPGPSHPLLFIGDNGSACFTRLDGRQCEANDSSYDIIGPWIDEAASPVEPEPLSVGDRVRVLEDAPAHRNQIGTVSSISSCGGYFDVDFTPIGSCVGDVDHYSRCQLEKLPVEPPVDEAEELTATVPCPDCNGSGRDNVPYGEPCESCPPKPWSPPKEFRELGWMVMDGRHGNVEFYEERPSYSGDGSRTWCGRGYIGSMTVSVASALNLIPTSWGSVPESDRVVFLG